MQSQRLVVKLNTAWECEYFKTRSFTLPPGKYLSYTAVENKPDSTWLTKGVNFINVNAGIDPLSTGLQFGQRACFIFNPEYIKAFGINSLGGKVLKDFSVADCQNAVNSFIDPRDGGFAVITSGAHEYDDSNYQWAPQMVYQGDSRVTPTPTQYEALDRQMAAKVRLKGGEYFGGYDGHMGAGGLIYTNPSSLLPAYSDGLTALNICKANIASGPGNPFFTDNAWAFRGGLINTYFGGGDINPAHLASLIVNFELNQIALNYVGGANTRICSFMFLSKREFPGVGYGYTDGHRNYLTPTDYFESYTFSVYAPNWQMMLGYMSYVFCSDIFAWEDTSRRGLNPNILQFDRIRDDGFPLQKYYGSGNPQRATLSSKYEARDMGYLEMPYGPGHDALMIGIENYTKMVQWAGSASQWAKHRKTGDANYCTLGVTYTVDRFTNNEPIARVHSNGNRRSLFFYNVTAQAGTSQSYDVDLFGGVFTFVAEAGVPYFFLIDLAA